MITRLPLGGRRGRAAPLPWLGPALALLGIATCQPPASSSSLVALPTDVPASHAPLAPPSLDSSAAAGPLSIPGPSDFLAIGSGSLWVPASGTGSVVRVDPVSSTVEASIRVEPEHGRDVVSPYSIAFAEDVWATVRSRPYRLVAIDPEHDEVVREIPVDSSPYGVAAGEGLVWASFREAGEVVAFDVDTGATMVRVDVAHPSGLAWDGRVWVVRGSDQMLLAIHPDGEVSEIAQVGRGTQGIVVAGGTVWTADGTSGSVTRVDADTGRASTAETGAGTWTISAGEAGVWAGSYTTRTIYELDPVTGQVMQAVPAGMKVNSIAVINEDVWIGSWDGNVVQRVVDG